MSRYKYFIVTIMLLLFVYSLFLDISYPFLDNARFEDIERIQKEMQELKPQDNDPHTNQTHHCTVYNMTPGYRENFECVKTRTQPAATVCLYPPGMDMYISHDLRETGQWEPQILNDFFEVMKKDPSLGLIDVGANIGYYTMLAVALGRKAVAVEPSEENIQHLHRSVVVANATDRVTVLQNAIADLRARSGGVLYGGAGNRGDVRVHLDGAGAEVRCRGSCPPRVDVILLDDLLEVLVPAAIPRAVLKLDIQGDEHRALSHAEELLTRIHIPVIFMEWGVMKSYYLPGDQTSSDKFLVENMLRVLFKHDYRPYALTVDGGKPLDPAVWNKWPFDITWRKLPNSEELAGAMRNHFFNWPVN